MSVADNWGAGKKIAVNRKNVAGIALTNIVASNAPLVVMAVLYLNLAGCVVLVLITCRAVR